MFDRNILYTNPFARYFMVRGRFSLIGLSVLFYLLISFSVSAQQNIRTNLSSSDYSQLLLNRFKEMTTAGVRKTTGIPNRAQYNKTMLMLEVKKNWNKLTPEVQKTFSTLISRPIGLSKTYLETTKNFFKFYYTTTGANAVSTTDANANGVPDYVENMADAFTKSLAFYDSLGYNRPPIAASDNNRYCVYISNAEAGNLIYGYSQPETNIGDNPLTGTVESGSLTSYMVMRNDYVGFGSTTAELQIAMEVTAAHEFFHAVQFGYEYDKMEGYLMEMCSTWAEDKIFPGDDDNWQYLSDIFGTPDVSLDWDESLDGDAVNYSSDYAMHWYAAWIFMRYVTDHFGAEIPKFIFEINIKNSTSTAIDNVMQSRGTSYTAMIKDYYVALGILTQSSTAPMSQYSFQRGNDYRTVTKNSGGSPTGPFLVNYEKTLNYNGTKVTYSSTSGNKRLMRASADYIKITPSTNFSVTVTPKTANPNFVVRLIESNSFTNPTSLSVVEPALSGNSYTINVSDKSLYSSYVLVFYNAKYSTAVSRDTTSIQYDVTVDAPLLTNGVRLISPVGGESWQIGSNHNITWESANVANVKLEYSTDNGTAWNAIVDSTPAAAGSYVWMIPATASASCKVRISDISNAAYTSMSTNAFSIIEPLPFSLISPNGGESWQVGSNHDITWNKGNVANVMIQLTTDGSTWSTVVASTPAASGKYSWTIPDSLSTSCKIKISDVANVSINSVSSNTFSIIPKVTQVTLLTEDFSKVATGSIGSPGSNDLAATLDTYTLSTGWTGVKVYAAGGALKIGSSSAMGYIVTPPLDLSGNGGTGTLKFDIQAYGSDTKVMQVLFSTDNGITYTQLGPDLTPTSSMATQSVEFSGGTSASKFKISAKVAASNRFYLDDVSVISSGITAIRNSASENYLPNGFELAQNYPNPFNPSTTIRFTLPARMNVQLNIFNQLGEKVTSLINEEFQAGIHSVVWNGSNQPSGIYFYELRAGNYKVAKKLLLMK